MKGEGSSAPHGDQRLTCSGDSALCVAGCSALKCATLDISLPHKTPFLLLMAGQPWLLDITSTHTCHLNDVPVKADALQQLDLMLKLLQLGWATVPQDLDGHVLHPVLETAVHLQPAKNLSGGCGGWEGGQEGGSGHSAPPTASQ